MDFFAQQDDARRRTGLLVFLYCFAVILIILAIYFAVVLILHFFIGENGAEFVLWNPVLMIWVCGITLLIVASGSIYKIAQLASGGSAVAAMLGGRRIAPDTKDQAERRLINVVEEMAIASGASIPEVYILDDEYGINAFAAGFTVRDAIVAVTRGTLERLSRDELQGVIAHEFSHILNGDMRLNIKLTGILHGILVIALLGYVLMRSLRFSGRSRRNSKGGGAAIAVFLLGLSLWVIGYIGVFFANLIKSAVSRQREYLADASAVQFTRNPDGIGGALKQIAALSSGSRIRNEHADEAGHFFFANGMRAGLLGIMATHPPLNIRIERILRQAFEAVPEALVPRSGRAAVSGFSDGGAAKINGAALLEGAGNVSAGQLVHSRELLAGIPAVLNDAAHHHMTARAVVFGLLLDDVESVRQQQLQRLSEYADDIVYSDLLRLMPELEALTRERMLPLAELCISGLRSMPEADYRRFVDNLEYIVAADGEMDLFEYTLMRMIKRHVAVEYEKRPDVPVKYRRIGEVSGTVCELLSCLAYWDEKDPSTAQAAYAEAVSGLEIETAGMLAADECGLERIDTALDVLAQAAPGVKRKVLDAAARCIGADGIINAEEAELLRAIADAFDCPVPPPVV